MSKKIIFAGACTLLLLALLKVISELALAERGYYAFGSEICVLIIAFSWWVVAKTINDIRRRSNNERI